MTIKMNTKLIPLLFLILVTAVSGQNDLPKIFSGDAQKIFSYRQAYLKGELKKDNSVNYLVRQAEKLLDMEPVSVMDKEQIPPSGDKHDYMSMGKYWWPNPDTKDGLPYIRKDGQVNPESKNISDASNSSKLISSVEMLSVAYYVTNDSKYSAKASQLLRVWFIDEKSKMNPNLNYAQFAPGKNEGTKSGIIDVHNFYRLVDAIGLLENSKEWTKEDDKEIKNWFNEYLTWLKTSKNGVGESKSKNNHGTWYDVQVVSISLFLGKNDFAKQYLNDALIGRVSTQIKNDGTQPFELVRTKSWSYSLFNLEALFHLAVLGDNVGVNFWNFTNEEGGCIRKALDYILPSALDIKLWPHLQIEEIKNTALYPMLIMAQEKYDENIYSSWRKKIFGNKAKISIHNFM